MNNSTAFLLLLSIQAGLAGPGEPDKGFQAAISKKLHVTAVAEQRDDRLLVAGAREVGSNMVPAVIRLTPSGKVDRSFNVRWPREIRSGVVQAVRQRDDGRISAVGTFETGGGVIGAAILLTSSGAIDSSYPLQTNVAGAAIASDGSLLFPVTGQVPGAGEGSAVYRVNAAGAFEGVPSFFVPAPARIYLLTPMKDNSAAGAVADNGFSSVFNSCLRANFQGRVNAIAEGAGCSLYVAADGNPGEAKVIHFNPGYYARDGQFNFDHGTVASVSALDVQADGKIVFAGRFVEHGITLYRVARVTATGAKDVTFLLGTGAAEPVVGLRALKRKGQILAWGGFSKYNDRSRRGLVLLKDE